jgi:hypothetical protein
VGPVDLVGGAFVLRHAPFAIGATRRIVECWDETAHGRGEA